MYPDVLPPLQRRDGNGHTVVREKEEGEEKRQVRGRGGEKRRNKMRAATGAGAKSDLLLLRAVFMNVIAIACGVYGVLVTIN